MPHFPVWGRAWQCPQRGRGPAVLTRPGVRLQEAPGLLPRVCDRQRARRVPRGAGDPRHGTASPSCPGGLCTGAGRAALAAESFLGQPGECPGRPGTASFPGQGSGQECRWCGGRGSCSLPSLVGVCGVCRGPGATGRNRFGRPGEALSRSAGVELGTADAGVPPAHPAPRS